MTMCRFIEEPCNGKLLSTVLKTNGVGDNLVEFTNYHKFCKMDGSRFTLWNLNHRAFMVFNKETKQDKHSSRKLIEKAFPKVPYSEFAHIKVKGNKSPFDGDLIYWTERNSKLYDGITSKLLRKQNHTCGKCGYKLTSEERVHLHHIDGNHENWKDKNLTVLHESCHDYIHMGKRENKVDLFYPARKPVNQLRK